MNEKVVEVIKDCLKCCPWGEVTENTAEEIAKTLERENLLKAEWKNARTEVPEDESEVFVCTLSKKGIRNVDKGYYFSDRWVHRGSSEVTHWKPIDMPEVKE